ncbi:urease accessory protein UreE [Mycolicibacterium komossense]|uniref:Urease accessory protein UreE n=1 Tax=Mycolicibacterium komossense TaxID=1779 RepID=A0ABT3CET5_9MYCO|nr:urease accessory protein UreE [Mycolicibacterium komossense]MCV7228000.1 urease accessory protein UreE [Mycolicibacterium komossense]
MTSTTTESGIGKPILVERILGNQSDAQWVDRLAVCAVEEVLLDQWEAQKSRIRRPTTGNREVAISLERGVQLRDGDVLWWDAQTSKAIVARIDLSEVLEVDLSALVGRSPEAVIQTCVELGHALGNQHWPAVIKGTKVYVPLTVAQPVMNSVMRTHALEGVRHRFIPGAEVIPYIAPHEARRLFGGAARDSEGHTHDPKE